MDPAREPGVVAVGGGCGIFVVGCWAGVGVDAVPVGCGFCGAPGGAEEGDAEGDAEEEAHDSAGDIQSGVEPKFEGLVFAAVAPAVVADLIPSPGRPGDEGKDAAKEEEDEDDGQFVGRLGGGEWHFLLAVFGGTDRGTRRTRGAWPEAIIDLTLRLCIPFVKPEMWNPGFHGQPGFAARFQAVLSVRWVGMHSWVPGCDHGSQSLI